MKISSDDIYEDADDIVCKLQSVQFSTNIFGNVKI